MELFRLLGTIALDSTNAKQEIDKYIEKAKESESESSEAFRKIGGAAVTIAKGIGVAGAAIGGAFVAAVEGTREYREQMGLLDSAFQTSGHSSEAAKQTYSALNAVLGDTGQAVEASQHLALIADNETELSELTHTLTGVYATFGESLPLEGLAEGINHTASLGEVQGSLADALEWSGITVDDFNDKLAKCATEEERQDLIMKTLNSTYKDAADQYKATNGEIMASRQAQERLSDAIAKVGEVGEPVMAAVTNAIASMAEKAVPVIENLVNGFRGAVTWIKTNQETVQAWVGVIIGATTAIGTFILIISWGKIMTAAANAIKVVRLAMLAFNATLLANPIGLVIAALAGLVAAFVYLWNNCESFRKFWINLWNKIKKTASDAWSAIKKSFSGIGSWFKSKFDQVQKAGKDAMDKVKKWFSDAYRGLTRTFSSVGSWFRGKFQSAWSGIKAVFSGWGSFFGGLWTKIKAKFGSIGSSLGKAMGGAVKSGLNKVLSSVENTINKGVSLINSAIGLANKLPGISVGKVPKINLPRLWQGAVLEKGQMGLLEGSGAEAVVPLHNNKKWLSRLAEDLDEIQQGKVIQSPVDIGRIEAMLARIIEILETLTRMQIYLDSGVLVGELTEPINKKLGTIYTKNMRGSTR